MSKEIKIFDTTLRDGEQSPGCSMNIQEKLEMAKQLERLKVDVIEAGFAIASPGDFKSVKTIADQIKDCTIASLARTVKKDIDYAWEAVKGSASPRIHTFIATSEIHMKYKLRMEAEQVLNRAVEMVKYAKGLCYDIEFSAEDASRSNSEFLYRIFEEVIKAGATVINIPDTVGYTTPNEFYNLISGIRNNVPNIDKAQISVHCHNDLGLGVANSIAAIQAGAEQIECTINGIGERAGNAALEEIVMCLNTRKDFYEKECRINTTQIYRTSRLLSKLTGVKVQPNKSIVGENAFAHESGIHQHGMLSNQKTYEIMTPESIGLSKNKMVLGKHSGKHAFQDRLRTLGFNLSEEEILDIFEQFKILADKKKVVSDKDIEALIDQKQLEVPSIFELDRFIINSGNTITATATVRIKKDGQLFEGVSIGDGPIDAAFKAIEGVVGYKLVLEDFNLNSVTEGKDAQGEAYVKISDGADIYHGRGLSTDVVEASIKGYIDAVNQMLYSIKTEEEE